MVFVLVVGMIFFVFNGFHYYDERSWRFRTFYCVVRKLHRLTRCFARSPTARRHSPAFGLIPARLAHVAERAHERPAEFTWDFRFGEGRPRARGFAGDGEAVQFT